MALSCRNLIFLIRLPIAKMTCRQWPCWGKHYFCSLSRFHEAHIWCRVSSSAYWHEILYMHVAWSSKSKHSFFIVCTKSSNLDKIKFKDHYFLFRVKISDQRKYIFVQMGIFLHCKGSYCKNIFWGKPQTPNFEPTLNLQDYFGTIVKDQWQTSDSNSEFHF